MAPIMAKKLNCGPETNLSWTPLFKILLFFLIINTEFRSGEGPAISKKKSFLGALHPPSIKTN
jgi:hypothetical protein